MSHDRADICFNTNELCRSCAVPDRNSHERLKRVCRYPVGKPRLVHKYDWGSGAADDNYLEVYRNTDVAGCKETRRSTSGGVCLFGGSNVKQWSKTQTTIALPSGEAELHGTNSGITQGLGLQSTAKDLSFDLTVRAHSDATAALGIYRRRGLGIIWHLDVADLLPQDKVRSGVIKLCKILGAEDPANIMTNYVEKPLLENMWSKMNIFVMEGRTACAPATAR